MMTSRPRFHSFGRMSLGRQASPAPEPAAKASAKHLGLKTTLDFSHTSRWYEACCTREDWTEKRKYGSLVIAKMYKDVRSCSIFNHINHHIQCFCFWCNRVCVMCCLGLIDLAVSIVTEPCKRFMNGSRKLQSSHFIYIKLHPFLITYIISIRLIMDNHDCMTFQCQESSKAWKWSQWAEQTQQSEQEKFLEKFLGFKARVATMPDRHFLVFSVIMEAACPEIANEHQHHLFQRKLYLQGFYVIFFHPWWLTSYVIGKGDE